MKNFMILITALFLTCTVNAGSAMISNEEGQAAHKALHATPLVTYRFPGSDSKGLEAVGYTPTPPVALYGAKTHLGSDLGIPYDLRQNLSGIDASARNPISLFTLGDNTLVAANERSSAAMTLGKLDLLKKLDLGAGFTPPSVEDFKVLQQGTAGAAADKSHTGFSLQLVYQNNDRARMLQAGAVFLALYAALSKRA